MFYWFLRLIKTYLKYISPIQFHYKLDFHQICIFEIRIVYALIQVCNFFQRLYAQCISFSIYFRQILCTICILSDEFNNYFYTAGIKLRSFYQTKNTRKLNLTRFKTLYFIIFVLLHVKKFDDPVLFSGNTNAFWKFEQHVRQKRDVF